VGLFAGGCLGAILLVVAEFTTLYRAQTSRGILSSTGTGPNDSYALIPIAVLVLLLALAVLRVGSRPALLAIGISGLVALLIALLGDLPDANSTRLTGCQGEPCVEVLTTPGPGMYLETGGAILLIAVAGLGFLLLGGPEPPSTRVAEKPPAQAEEPTGRPQSGS
jgi:hypothetical protein